MLLLSNQDCQRVLNMAACIEALEAAYGELARGDAAYRGRIDFYVPVSDGKSYFRWSSAEGASRSLHRFAIRMKLDITSWPEGGTEEKYCMKPGTFCGLILLGDTNTAEPLAILQDGYLQHMRAGAAAAIGVKYLARENATTVGMIGSGGMAREYLRAFCHVRNIKSAKVYSPNVEHRKAYAREMSRDLGITVMPVDTAEEAARGCDIFSTCTNSVDPVMSASFLEPGMHFTDLNSYEVDPEVFNRCDVIIKLGSASIDPKASGGFTFHGEMAGVVIGTPDELARIPGSTKKAKKVFLYPHLVDLIAGRVKGRTDDKQITCFLNSGTQGLQFVSLAAKAFDLARAQGLGRELPKEWFLQDIRD